ncbi:UNVERIFIED_CONTAM: protein EI24 [Sesamum calycinum]|uniref:Protein EI24 n=1 Tax=Sesamum calycinum TaxID=2727403 RepID=A0AAW2PM15_9LAMI
MGSFRTRLKQASLLWVEGFREACCLHRVVIYCRRSREVAIRTGQCFLLNGIIFLGSIFVLRSVVIPTLQWVLPDECQLINYQESCPFGGIYYWVHPLHRKGIELSAPCMGYAYYCFEYKWNYSGVSLDKRLDFFECNWPFFAGFGSPCVLAVFFYSPLVSYGVMATLYPLVLYAAAPVSGEIFYAVYIAILFSSNFNDASFPNSCLSSEADKAIASQRKKWKGAGLGRIPIFVSADYLSMKVLSLPNERRQQVHNQKTL